MKKKLSFLMAGVLLFTSLPNLTARADELEEIEVREQEIQNNQNLIQNQLAEIQAVDSNIDVAFAEIERLGEERVKLTEEIEALQGEIEALDKSIKENESKKERLEKSLAEKIEVFKKRLDVMYKSRDIGTINVLLESSNADDFLTRLNSMKAVAGYDKEIITELNEMQDELEVTILNLKGTKASRDQAFENLTFKEASLLDSINEQNSLIAALQNNKDLAQGEVERLNGIVSNLNSEIDNLNIQYQERLRKEEEARIAAEKARQEEIARVEAEKVAKAEAEAAARAQAATAEIETTTSSNASSGIVDTYVPEVAAPAQSSYYVPFTGYVEYFNQREEPWASHRYGTGYHSSIAANGCGPTSMAMVLSSMTNQYVTPSDMADFSMANGHVMPGDGGSYWSLFPSAARKYGLNCVQTTSRSQINQALSNGAMVIASQDNSLGNYWTYGGHFIVLTGIDANGYISVADPWSRAKSVISHSQDTVYIPMKSAWIISGN